MAGSGSSLSAGQELFPTYGGEEGERGGRGVGDIDSVEERKKGKGEVDEGEVISEGGRGEGGVDE
jgi:hypothetical protein